MITAAIPQQELKVASKITRYDENGDCGRYCWSQFRAWSFTTPDGIYCPGKGTVCFVLLRPVAANGEQESAQVMKCIRFAQSWGYDTLTIRFLFPRMATSSRDLFRMPYSDSTCGRRGSIHCMAAMTANLVIAAWGSTVPFGRDKFFLCSCRDVFPKKSIHCLGTKNGHPVNLLLARQDAQPQLFREDIIHRSV